LKLLDDLIHSRKYIFKNKILSTIEKQTVKFDTSTMHSIFNDSEWVNKSITNYIRSYAKTTTTYTINKICNTPIIINIVDFGKSNNDNEDVLNILIWLHMMRNYINKRCSKPITIFLYKTPCQKVLPENGEIIGPYNLNSGATYWMNDRIEIICWRKEEWFRVFVHECMHGFNLDFAMSQDSGVVKKVRSKFPINKEINLFEVYTELWAKIINCLFCSYKQTKSDEPFNKVVFIENFNFCMKIESLFVFFQMTKILNYMKLNYTDLYSISNKSAVVRNTLYKEKSNFFEYFVLLSSLILHYDEFMIWCHKNNNPKIIKFKDTVQNQEAFLKLIFKFHKTPALLNTLNRVNRLHSDPSFASFYKTCLFSICV